MLAMKPISSKPTPSEKLHSAFSSYIVPRCKKQYCSIWWMLKFRLYCTHADIMVLFYFFQTMILSSETVNNISQAEKILSNRTFHISGDNWISGSLQFQLAVHFGDILWRAVIRNTTASHHMKNGALTGGLRPGFMVALGEKQRWLSPEADAKEVEAFYIFMMITNLLQRCGLMIDGHVLINVLRARRGNHSYAEKL